MGTTPRATRTPASADATPTAPAVQVTLGVDTHAEQHVAAALDQHGRLLGTRSIPTTPSSPSASAPSTPLGTSAPPDPRFLLEPTCGATLRTLRGGSMMFDARISGS